MFRLVEQGLEEQSVFVATFILLVFLLGAIGIRAGGDAYDTKYFRAIYKDL